jgi:hypothetical protein
VSALAVPFARARGGAVRVLHVIETDVLTGAGRDRAWARDTPRAMASGVNACVAAHAASHVIILELGAGILGRPSADALLRTRPALRI